MAQIRVEKLTKTFRIAERRAGLAGAFAGLVKRTYREVQALAQIDFQIEAGELVGYIGPNGAGKSTTIKILSGILVPTAGHCEINGRVPWRDRMAHVRHIGVVFGQRTQLWWDLNRKLVELHLAANTIRWREIDHGAALQIAASQRKGTTGREHP